MPPEIWAATNVVIDIITGVVTCEQRPLFDSIEVGPQASPSPEIAEIAVAA